jgi:hypothetical protein
LSCTDLYIYKKNPCGPDEFVKRRGMSPSTADYTISQREKGKICIAILPYVESRNGMFVLLALRGYLLILKILTETFLKCNFFGVRKNRQNVPVQASHTQQAFQRF